MKKIINISIYVITISMVLLFLFYMFVPKDITNKITKNKDNILCKLPVKIEEKFMEPIVNQGDIIIFNKCFETKDIQKQTPVVFRHNSENVVVLVKEISNNKIFVYQPNNNEVFNPITYDDILAIYYEEENPNSPIKKDIEKVEFKDSLVLVPQNWKVVKKEENSLIIQNIQEEDFQTYFQVYTENIDNKWIEYIQEFKSKIKQLAPSIEIISENIVEINNNDFYIIDTKVTQKNQDYFVLFALLKKENQAFVFSFNSLQFLKENNSPIFYQVLNNFYFTK